MSGECLASVQMQVKRQVKRQVNRGEWRYLNRVHAATGLGVQRAHLRSVLAQLCIRLLQRLLARLEPSSQEARLPV